MAIKFINETARNALGKRLLTLAEQMRRAFDQGCDGQIGVDDDMIDDIRVAAACVLLAEIDDSAHD